MKNEEKRWAVMIFFLGIIFGISGNLVANLIDRYFVRFGGPYIFFVVGLFVALAYQTYKEFPKLMNNKED